MSEGTSQVATATDRFAASHAALKADPAVQFTLQRFEKGLAVRDAGQAVAVGQAADLFFRAFAFADVAHQAEYLARSRGDQPRLEVMHGAEAHQFVIDRADVLGVEHRAHLFDQAFGDVAREHLGDVLADARFHRKGGDGGVARPLVARLVIEIETVAVEAEKRVGNGRQHGAVVGVGSAQAHDGVGGAQHVQHTVAENRPVDRLRDEIGGAYLVGVGDGLDVVAAGDHDDRHRRAGFDAADLAAGREAVHVRHLDVEQDQVRRHTLEVGDGLGAIFRFDAVESDLAEHFEHQEPHDRIIVGDQDDTAFGRVGGCHVNVPSLRWH